VCNILMLLTSWQDSGSVGIGGTGGRCPRPTVSAAGACSRDSSVPVEYPFPSKYHTNRARDITSYQETRHMQHEDLGEETPLTCRSCGDFVMPITFSPSSASLGVGGTGGRGPRPTVPTPFPRPTVGSGRLATSSPASSSSGANPR